MQGKKADALKDHHLTEEEKRIATEALIEFEKDQPLTNRKTAGDASESGLIKFLQAIYDIEDYRHKHPTFSFE